MVAAEQRVGEERPLDLLAPNRPEDSRGRDALVNVEADGVDVEARVLRLAGPDELGVLMGIERREIALAVLETALLDHRAILGRDTGLRNVRPGRVRMPVVADAVLVDWGGHRG